MFVFVHANYFSINAVVCTLIGLWSVIRNIIAEYNVFRLLNCFGTVGEVVLFYSTKRQYWEVMLNFLLVKASWETMIV